VTTQAPEKVADDRARARRELTATVLLCAAGALVELLSVGRPWARVAARTYTGSDVAGAVRPLALVALAGTAALLATRRWGRIAVGVLLVAAGVGAAVAAIGAGYPPSAHHLEAWRIVTVIAAVPVALAGLAAAARGYRWSVMSARYDAPGARQRVQDPDVALWDALDRGDDPTG
jgi:MFS family permease